MRRAIDYLFRLSIVVGICLFTPVHAADNLQRIIPVGSSEFQTIRLLYVEAALSPPSATGPWSVAELVSMLDRLEGRPLSETGAQTRDTLREELIAGTNLGFRLEDSVIIHPGMELAFEGYLHSDGADSELVSFDDEWDWVVGYTERMPFALASLEISLHDWFYTYCEIAYHKNRYGYDTATAQTSSAFLYSPFFSSNYFDLQFLDFETPYRAFVSVGGDGWNVEWGRDLLNWGNGRTGNLIIGDHLDYHDFIKFVSFHDTFKYTALSIFMNHPDFTSQGEVPSPGFKMFLGHRLELRLFEDRVGVAASENVMYQDDAIDLQYLNPAYILHNLNNRSMFNAIASIEADIAVLPGVTAYGQFVIDQARAPLEDASQPDCFGVLTGVDIVVPTGAGYLTTNIEFVETDPYLYQRDLVDFKVSRRHFIIGFSNKVYTDFLGYQYGGDALVKQLLFGYTIPGKGGVQAGVRRITHGNVRIDTVISTIGDYPDPEDMTPHGPDPEETTILTLRGDLDIGALLDIKALAKLTSWVQLDHITIVNRDNVLGDDASDLQLVFGISAGI